MPGHSTEIANEFIKRAQERGLALTQMQLQKLVYLAHGWTLAVLGGPLVTDRVQAWEYGPVYPALYRALKRYGSAPVSRLIVHGDFDRLKPFSQTPVQAGLTPQEHSLIDKVFDAYGGYPAFQLSALTHEPNSPWSKVTATNAVIPDELIKDYFVRLSRGR